MNKKNEGGIKDHGRASLLASTVISFFLKKLTSTLACSGNFPKSSQMFRGVAEYGYVGILS